MQGTIRNRYESLSGNLREPYLARARECAKYTLPMLFPPVGSTGTTKYYQPYQSLGARGVNNLASKLLLTLLPANSPFFKLGVDDFMLERLTQQEGLRAKVEEALGRIERAVMGKIEASNIRTVALEALKQLVVGGNVLLYFPPEGGVRLFRLDRYVVKRSPSGTPLEIITHERLSAMELPPELRHLAGTQDAAGQKSGEDTVDVYTRVYRGDNGWWGVQQEVAGQAVMDIPDSYPPDSCPWLPLGLIRQDGEDYARSYVEEYIGDLKSLEGLSKAILQGSAAAAKVLFLLRPNATTKAKDVAEAESGAIKTGNKEDISVVQMEKYADFRVALEQIQRLTASLSFAFLLNTAIQRDAERVTAEEIRLMAAELESSLGGIYSSLSQEFQLPMVSYLMYQMEGTGEIPPLPKGIVKPTLTTGMEALGRGHDLTKLQAFIQTISIMPEAPMYLNTGDAITRIGVSLGIDMKGLVRSAEEIAAMQQQQQQQAMVEKLGPNVINAVAQQQANK